MDNNMVVASFKEVMNAVFAYGFFSMIFASVYIELLGYITKFLDKKSFMKRFKYKELIDFTKENKINLDDFVSYSIDEAMKNYKKNNGM